MWYQQIRESKGCFDVYYSDGTKIFVKRNVNQNVVRCDVGYDALDYLLKRDYKKDGIDRSIPYDENRLR